MTCQFMSRYLTMFTQTHTHTCMLLYAYAFPHRQKHTYIYIPSNTHRSTSSIHYMYRTYTPHPNTLHIQNIYNTPQYTTEPNTHTVSTHSPYTFLTFHITGKLETSETYHPTAIISISWLQVPRSYRNIQHTTYNITNMTPTSPTIPRRLYPGQYTPLDWLYQTIYFRIPMFNSQMDIPLVYSEY